MIVRERKLSTLVGGALVVFAVLFAGCGMHDTSSVSPSTPQMGSLQPSTPQTENATPTLRQTENWHTGQSIIVASQLPLPTGNTIRFYPPLANGDVPPTRVITASALNFGSIVNIAEDADGFLYVAEATLGAAPGSAIAVFPPGASGNSPPVRLIQGNLAHLEGMVGMDVDAAGTVYVAVNGPQLAHGFVLVFAPGANGNVFPTRWLFPKLTPKLATKTNVVGVAVGTKSLSLVTFIQGSPSATNLPTYLDFFPLDAQGMKAPTCGFTAPLANSNGVTLTGTIAAAPFASAVWVFSPFEVDEYQTCDSTPVARLGGPATGILDVDGLALDGKTDTLYVLTHGVGPGLDSVRMFLPQNQNGNVAPNDVLAGPQTHLGDTVAIAIGF